MPKLDESRPFLPVNIAVLTVSDTRTEADDKSGRTLAEMIERDGHKVAARRIVRDDRDAIAAQLRAWIGDPAIDCVIATHRLLTADIRFNMGLTNVSTDAAVDVKNRSVDLLVGIVF